MNGLILILIRLRMKIIFRENSILYIDCKMSIGDVVKTVEGFVSLKRGLVRDKSAVLSVKQISLPLLELLILVNTLAICCPI